MNLSDCDTTDNSRSIIYEIIPPTSLVPAAVFVDQNEHPSPGERGYWNKGCPHLIIPSQQGIAVYENEFGQAVIRQEDVFDDDEDHWS